MPLKPHLIAAASMTFQDPPAWKGIKGKKCKALTTKGRIITGWIPDFWTFGDKQYFCHGYSLKTWKNHGYTIFSGESVLTVLNDEYIEVDKNTLQKGDVVSFHTAEHIIEHSCRIKIPNNNNYLNSTVKTKNGLYPLKTCTLQQVWGEYPLSTKLRFWRHPDKFELFEMPEDD